MAMAVACGGVLATRAPMGHPAPKWRWICRRRRRHLRGNPSSRCCQVSPRGPRWPRRRIRLRPTSRQSRVAERCQCRLREPLLRRLRQRRHRQRRLARPARPQGHRRGFGRLCGTGKAPWRLQPASRPPDPRGASVRARRALPPDGWSEGARRLRGSREAAKEAAARRVLAHKQVLSKRTTVTPRCIRARQQALLPEAALAR
mmetsp:Transcript_98303/g.277983  ORF Transcript_98303/g.277983 Transcript_98303/m.277983 type:complete len:202 (+) Transcript_98303:554-1159(+)